MGQGRETETPNSTPYPATDIDYFGKAINETLHKPAPVRINVKGAFVVDEDPVTPRFEAEARAVHDTKGIRLPHHTEIVSHVAIDVRSTRGHRCQMYIDHDRYRSEVLWPN